ncbi:MAG TPA: hypothetical protein VHV47_03765 [Opitutaceae bacterium]|jgi:hypothetical protein|nr:hypothetical protein [Opitutaceae bacterium]
MSPTLWPAADAATPAPPPPPVRGRSLIAAWVAGDFRAAVFQHGELGAEWRAPGRVRSLEELEGALDAARAALGSRETDVALLLEHEQFLHRVELAPSLAPAAARTHLQARVARHAGRPVWAAERMAAVRQDAAYMLHVLPGAFHAELEQILRARRLRLTRLFPLSAPLLQALGGAESGDRPALAAAETGGVTTVVVGWPGGHLAFTRTFRAAWGAETERVSVEVNRSLLYAKQQLGTTVERIRLFGDERAIADIAARCGENREIVGGPLSLRELMVSAAALPSSHPANAVGEHRRRQGRRRLLRTVLIAASWAAVAALGFSAAADWAAWKNETHIFQALQARGAELRAEHAQLMLRQRAATADRRFVAQVEAGRLPPVAARFPAYVGSLLPGSIQLTELRVEWQEAPRHWSFRLAGTVRGGEEEGRAAAAGLQDKLEHGPLRAHVAEGGPVLTAQPGGFAFNLEGTLFEN